MPDYPSGDTHKPICRAWVKWYKKKTIIVTTLPVSTPPSHAEIPLPLETASQKRDILPCVTARKHARARARHDERAPGLFPLT